MDRQQLDHWVEAYVRAWNSNTPDAIGALFSEDAEYQRTPFSESWVGRDEIVTGWLGIHDEPGTFAFDWRVLATGDVGVVRGLTTYFATRSDAEAVYSNIWVIELDPDGRCRAFTEWWMQRPTP